MATNYSDEFKRRLTPFRLPLVHAVIKNRSRIAQSRLKRRERFVSSAPKRQLTHPFGITDSLEKGAEDMALDIPKERSETRRFLREQCGR